MKIKELLKSTKGKVIAGALAVFILGAGVTTFALTREKGETAKESYDKKAEQMEEEAKEDNTDSAEKSAEASGEDKSDNKGEYTKSENKSKTEASTSSKSSSSSSSSVASSKSSSSSSSSSSPAPKKEKKWVVDKAAWTETVKTPVYERTKYYKIYGTNRTTKKQETIKKVYSYAEAEAILDNPAYDKTYDNMGYAVLFESSKVVRYDTKTINHPEVGHWE